MDVPRFMAGVRFFLPCLVRVYQYWSSHHDGLIKSVTVRGFFGLVRKRSKGERWLGTSCDLSAGASMDAELSGSRLIATKRLEVS